ncbi:MAG: RNA polymerase factor sigma-70 [Firmicutes bacterium ADurb.Bin300]|nr:MAG: RNA polymerase factor sigma-70 [Firmicutes bacterium ADurb.Bin300]HOD02567.1 sigma-70 family RNA polymerase sigma factor [Clostridiales bacterium]
MDDADIVELYWQRDESAIRETETKYGQYCFSIAFNILSDTEDSKECVNDTWFRAWNAIPPSRPDRLRIFLAKITRNLSFDKYRLKAANKRGGGEITLALEELGECVSSALDVEFEFYEQELVKSLNGFLYALPKRESNIFLRRYFYVESIFEIARRYGLKESNITVILSRTRQKLRLHLRKEGYVV